MENSIKEHSIDSAVEFGIGKTLTGMLKRIDKTIARENIDSLETGRSLADKLT